MWKKILFKAIEIIIFIVLVTSPFWSVVIVMECEGRVYGWNRSYTQAVQLNYKARSWYKRVGLEVKYDKL